jgi:ADP-dependent NAD(P)H-hydrate dehydratase / NAD(P)H-hydrate epimerase
MKILTAGQIRELDRRTTEEYGIPGLLLMENAGMRVVEAIEASIEDATGTHSERLESLSVAILCGKGNNGGDGLAVARQLIQRDCLPEVFLFAPPEEVRGDARTNLDILTRIGHPPRVVTDASGWVAAIREMGSLDVIVDALFGTGLNRPVEGFLAEVIASVGDELQAELVVAIDVPSGCVADESRLSGIAVEADMTVTLTALKHCLVFPPACDQAGDVVVASIGNPSVLLDSPVHSTDLLEPECFPEAHLPRPPDSHKGDYGRVLVIGGSIGKTGAPAMSGEAALRTGAGLVTVACPEGLLPTIAAHMPELMTAPLPETASGGWAASALDDARFQELLGTASVVAIGPGMGRDPETGSFVRKLVDGAVAPVVLDADALYAFHGHLDALEGASQPRVITPHPGEMGGLIGVDAREVQARRSDVAGSFATRHQLYVVLKGYRTLIATPSGRIFVNPTGNAGMASAGSGDVLTGMIAATLGQPHLGSFVERLCLAVYLHGLAGDIAAESDGEEVMTATGMLRFLPRAWGRLRGDESL